MEQSQVLKLDEVRTQWGLFYVGWRNGTVYDVSCWVSISLPLHFKESSFRSFLI